ncbi:MAG: sigma-54 dependent transcriptional regulator [Acidobacteriota bacterium]
MSNDLHVQLRVWRHLARAATLAEGIETIVPEFAEHLPLDVLLVRHLDVRDSYLETLAMGARVGSRPVLRPRNDLRRNALDRLLVACQDRSIRAVSRAGTDDPLAVTVPEGVHGQVLAGPLWGTNGVLGLAVLVVSPTTDLQRSHHHLAMELLEPLAAALDAHLRIHHILTECEAAQADRRTLLTKLGRREIGDTIVGADSGLREVMEQVDQVSQSDVPVLIFGETGSGKEVVARAIHNRSRRAAGPCLRVNCGAIPVELVDSELFGHERGSFTGAIHQRKGWFERADGGTLLLDEVAELSPAAQVRLLRVLQDGSFERVGGQRHLQVDVRIVAATHRDLFGMVSRNDFREDLWYRLAVFPIELPSLRQRPEDMPALAAHFALRASRRFGLPPLVPTRADIDLLTGYSWPGNIREFATVIDRAALLGNGERLEVAQALGVNRTPSATPKVREVAVGSRTQQDFPTLDDTIKAHIELALRATDGRVEGPHGASTLLDVNPHTLRSRMRRLGVDWTGFRRR